jgi:hypothetical protein
MPTIRKRGNSYKIEVYKKGVRESRTFPTEELAWQWAREKECQIDEGRLYPKKLEDMFRKGERGLLSLIPRRTLEAALAVPYSHAQVVTNPIPANITSGVYFLIQRGEVVYVGQSKNVFHRLARHVRDGRDFEAFNVITCPESELDALESQYIIAFAPRMNTSFGVTKGLDKPKPTSWRRAFAQVAQEVAQEVEE